MTTDLISSPWTYDQTIPKRRGPKIVCADIMQNCQTVLAYPALGAPARCRPIGIIHRRDSAGRQKWFGQLEAQVLILLIMRTVIEVDAKRSARQVSLPEHCFEVDRQHLYVFCQPIVIYRRAQRGLRPAELGEVVDCDPADSVAKECPRQRQAVETAQFSVVQARRQRTDVSVQQLEHPHCRVAWDVAHQCCKVERTWLRRWSAGRLGLHVRRRSVISMPDVVVKERVYVAMGRFELSKESLVFAAAGEIGEAMADVAHHYVAHIQP